MEWYYTAGEQRQGPVDQAEFLRKVSAGAVRNETLVWHAGMETWLPYAQVAAAEGLPSPGEASADAGAWPVAATEPPVVPVVVDEPADAETFWARLSARGYNITVGDLLEQGWALYKSAFWPNFGVTLLAYIIMMVAGAVDVVSLLAVVLITPQINAGLYWYFLRRRRGEHPGLADLFAGYSRGFLQLTLLVVIQLALLLPLIGLLALAMGGVAATENAGGSGVAAAPSLALVLGLALVGLVVGLLFYRFYMAPFFIVDKGYSAVAALKSSWRLMGLRFWTFVGLMLALVLLSLVGVIALLVGLLFVLPLLPAGFACAYETACETARRPGAGE